MSGELNELESLDITMRRQIPAPPDLVFRMWTEADLLKKWWGPPDVTCTEAEIDLKVGGSYRIANLFSSGEITWIHGEYELIDPPNRLVYTWGIGLENVPTERVTVTFQLSGLGTEVVVFHEHAPDVPTREGHIQGWDGCLDGLVEMVGSSGVGSLDGNRS